MRVTLSDGKVMDIADITEPMATHEYKCDWRDHKISSGRKYVRVVYKIKGGSFECKHFCPECWQEMNRD